jgi:hypothetical protein
MDKVRNGYNNKWLDMDKLEILREDTKDIPIDYEPKMYKKLTKYIDQLKKIVVN